MPRTTLSDLHGPKTEFRTSGDWLQYRSVGTADAWKNLILLSELQGLPGVNAVPADTAVGVYVSTNGTASQNAVDARIDAALADQDSSMFEGIDLFTYGNSWVASPYYGAAVYPDRVCEKLGFTHHNLSHSGYRMQDTAITAYAATDGRAWNTSWDGVVLLGDLLNNLIEADTEANRSAAREGLRSFCAMLGATYRHEQTSGSFTYTGSWLTPASAQPYASGGTVALSNTPATAALTVAVDANVHYLIVGGTNASSSNNGAIYEIRRDGVTIAEMDADDTTVSGDLGHDGMPVVIRIESPSLGSVQVVSKTASRPTCYTIIDGILTQRKTPPLIVIVKPVPVNISTHNKPTLLTYLRTLPDLVAAEFGGHVLVVDPLPGWNKTTMLGADGLHPNELGQEYLAVTVSEAIKRRARLASLGLR